MGRSERSAAWARACAFLCSALLVLTLIVLAACGGPPAESTVTVQGRVEAVLGLPLAGIVVRSQGMTTTTGADGGFTLAGVASPYTVSLSFDAPEPWMHVFEGLTTVQPTLVPYAGYFLPAMPVTAYQRTQVYGPLPGIVPAGRRAVVCVEGLASDVYGCDTLAAGDNAYAIDAYWALLGEVEARLHVLLFQVDGDGRPIAYESYGTVDLTLTPGVDAVQVAPDGPMLPSAGLQGTVAAAGGGTLIGALVTVRVGPRLAMRVYAGVPVGGAQVGGGLGLAWRVRDGPLLGTLALPVPPQLLLPADGVAGVTAATPFSAAHATTGPTTFVWEPLAAGPRLARTTSRRQVTMPDSAAVGLTLPPGAAYGWTVESHGPVDPAAATRVIPDALVLSLWVPCAPGLTDDGELAQSGRRELTLAP